MSIRATVKQALTRVPGGHFTTTDLALASFDTDLMNFTNDQVKRAIRDIPYVKRVDGHYIVKGRRVPAQQ